MRRAGGLLGGALGASLFFANGTAHAQTQSVLIQPAIDPDYNRGRNVSVLERPHPDYDALGIRLGSFYLYPSLAAGPVLTNNVYLDDGNKKADVYASFQPVLSVNSDWSNHRLNLVAAGDLRRYATQSLKNQNAWYVDGQGRIDVHSDVKVQLDAQIDKTYESPYFEDVVANLTVPSTFLRTYGAVTATYVPGRSRLIATADVSKYAFNTLRFADGSSRDQAYRDRTLYRGAVSYEYALSPSVAVYGQAAYDTTNYVTLAPNNHPNRDSTGFSLTAGTNFDLAGLARGSIGIGYSRRHYNATQVYPVAQGVSAQAKVELFPDELTTVLILAQRQLQDVSLSSSGAFWNNRVYVNVDHELLSNLIVSANIEAVRRQYVESRLYTDVYQFQTGGRYQANRRLGFNAELAYGQGRPSGLGLGNPFKELRATIGVRIRD